ncbi:MAG: GNAT family N-acetyltransferase [Rhodobacteraceae bacterium]|nr:GNAT family N-acetyltransferase [Paracoccaceae bacterium]
MATLDLSLRIATAADIAAVDRLLSRSYPRLLRADYPPSVIVTAVPLIARANPHLVASGRYYLAEAPGRGLVGAGGWSLKDRAQGVAEMRHLATDPDVLRQGVAGRIVAAVLAAARGAGAGRIDCLATRTAVPFYRAMGFRALGPVEIPLAPGIAFPAVRMARAL